MEDQAEGLPGNATKRNESLKSFSEVELLGELKGRLLASPTVNPAIVQTLQSTLAELQKKAETVKPPRVEPVVGPKVENSAKSEGAKWAEILRREGWGILGGKFRKSWTFINPQGKEEQISNEEGGFTGGGRFGSYDMPYVGKPRVIEVERSFLPQVDRYNFDSYHKRGEIFNSLILVDADESIRDFKNEFGGWKIFQYSSYLTNAPDARGGVIQLQFGFSLPPNMASDFISKVEKNPDLMEEVFQNMYPGLTGKGKAERVIVEKIRLVNKSSLKTGNAVTDLPFSSPVGETPHI